MKHSHAPWKVEETAFHIKVVAANGEVIFHEEKRIPGVIEDAHLVAADPDMLTALQEVLATPGLKSGLQAMCAAAVAKALGKSIDDVVKGV